MSAKSQAELHQEQEEARAHLDRLLSSTRPKNLREGVVGGVGTILQGAVGAAGTAVLAPIVGLTTGMKSGGVLGGIFGVTSGVVVGAVGAVGLAVGGVLSGVVQIARGVAATPEAVAAPMQGKWWNDSERKWQYTKMEDEKKALAGIPEDDKDILGQIEKELDASLKSKPTGEVVDTSYYDVLEVPTNAEPAVIKRNYYKMAKQYHPDKVGKDDQEAAEKFKMISEAYQVLSDSELRAKYDKEGKDGLSGDRTSINKATSAVVGDSDKISYEDARKIQKRRVTRLAIKLINKITPWVKAVKSGGCEMVEAGWRKEAEELSKASFGHELVLTIGRVYDLMGTQNAGSVEKGSRLPRLSKWASKQMASVEARKAARENRKEGTRALVELVQTREDCIKKMESAKTDAEMDAIARELQDASIEILIRVLWTTSVVDITSALNEATQMVFYDHSVDKEERQLRAQAVQKLGQIWMETPEPKAAENETSKDYKKLYEEAALAAMIETVKRKEEAVDLK